MAILYLDTSALFKLYVREPGTEFVLAQAHPDAGHRLAVLSLARVELQSALQNRLRQGDLTPDAVRETSALITQHFSGALIVQPVNETVIEAAVALTDRHGLRAYDALQLAGALVAGVNLRTPAEFRFLCSDAALVKAANSEGLHTINPADHT